MPTIVHLMGPTCAGKSTIIDTLLKNSNKVKAVQIGKLMRAKYGEDHFKGQAAPEHTKDEALQMYFDEINAGIADGKELILIDGQPRDLSQAKVMMRAWPTHDSRFFLIHADHEIRESRAKAGRAPGPNLDLALARLNNDYKNSYVVMTELLINGICIEVVDTGDQSFDVDLFARSLLGPLHTPDHHPV